MSENFTLAGLAFVAAVVFLLAAARERSILFIVVGSLLVGFGVRFLGKAVGC